MMKRGLILFVCLLGQALARVLEVRPATTP